MSDRLNGSVLNTWMFVNEILQKKNKKDTFNLFNNSDFVLLKSNDMENYFRNYLYHNQWLIILNIDMLVLSVVSLLLLNYFFHLQIL